MLGYAIDGHVVGETQRHGLFSTRSDNQARGSEAWVPCGVRRVWGSGARLNMFWCAIQGPRLTVGFESIPFHPASILFIPNLGFQYKYSRRDTMF